MTQTLLAQFDGKVLVPQGAVDFPKGKILELRVQSNEALDEQKNLPQNVNSFASWIETLPALVDSPGDGAIQHDHYLYGSTKKETP